MSGSMHEDVATFLYSMKMGLYDKREKTFLNRKK